MLFINKSTLPIKSVADWAKKAVETLTNNPYPEFTKRNYYWRFIGDKLELTTIFDIEKGKEEEGLMDLFNRVYPFFLSIDGLEIISNDAVFTLEQLFATISQEQAPTT